MELIPLTAALGVEVRGVDVASPPSPDDLAILRRAYAEHHLLLLRDQDVSPKAHASFVANFGPLTDDMGTGDFTAFISNLEMKDGGGGSGVLYFHSDLSFTRSPLHGISLYALVIPERGTTTRFASGVAAARTLPDDLRGRVAERTVHHVLPISTNRTDAKAREVAVVDTDPDFERPILAEHPRTAEPNLFVTDQHAHRVEGLDADESAQLLDDLFAHLYSDEHVYEHDWRVGDLLLWDNVALQHARGDVSQGGERTFRRVSINEFSIMELVPEIFAMGTPTM
jgi:taurine dioxygenase